MIQTGLFIRGGWEPLPCHKRERFYTGLPSRFGVGPFYFRFPVSDRMIAFEWSMVTIDQHPYAPWHASLHCPGGVTLQDGTFAGMEARLRAIDANEQAAGFYRDLKAEVDAARILPLRTERCRDRPDKLDFTRYVFGIEQIRPLIQRRGDYGSLIGKLLAVSNGADAAKGLEDGSFQADPLPEATADATITQLAEWIFSQRQLNDGGAVTKGVLRRKAQKEAGLSFTTRQFNDAYQRVYETKQSRRPLTGWPLREPYKSRET